MEHLIVPIDGSRTAWHAAEIAVNVARQIDGRVDLVEFVPEPRDESEALTRLENGIADLDAIDVPVTPCVDITTDSVAGALASRLDASEDGYVVMASHGRGRSAAVVGSVTEDFLMREFGPVVVVGPALTDTTRMVSGGPLLITVDSSHESETVLPLGAAWAIEFGVRPWIIEVISPGILTDEHRVDSSYVARLARDLSASSGHEVEYEVLRSHHVAAEVVEYAASVNASMIVASTHGRTGLSRLTMGSTAAGFVRHAPCPVVLARPPHLPD